MKPSYKLSHPDAGGNITLATKAKQVEVWLESLPHSDALVSASALTAYLSAHDRAGVASGLRRQILDMASATVARVLDALAAEFRAMPLPLDDRRRDRVDQVLALLSAVADFNKRLILECADRSPPLFGENPLPGHLGRFLRTAREIMAVCYLTHRQLPDGFWLDAHQTGLLLFEAGLAASPDPVRPASTLSESYQAVLLEAVADPYHFSEQERLWTQDVIFRHGNLASVEAARTTLHGGVYGIHAGQDKPPFPLSWQQGVVPDCDLVLNTAPLVRKLALIVSQLDRDKPSTSAAPAIRHPGYRDLLQRLKLIWGGSTQRATARHRPARQAQRKFIVGFDAVFRHLAGRPEEGAAVSCLLVNESLGGVALLVGDPSFRLDIGSLVCVIRGQGDAWHDIGLVRWFKTGANGVLTFGVKFLNGKAVPITWTPAGEGREHPGLLSMQEKGQVRTARSLVVPVPRVDPRARLEVRLGQERQTLKLAGKIETLPGIDIFRCDPVQADA
jgi:hypothetical protein